MSTHNLCFEQKYKKYQSLAKFSIYLNRCVFVTNHFDVQVDVSQKWSGTISTLVIKKKKKNKEKERKMERTFMI